MAEERLGASFNIDITSLRAGLTQANRLIRDSEAEFRTAAAGMDNWSESEEGLKKRQSALNDQIDIQKKKISALTAEKQRIIDKMTAEGKSAEEISQATDNVNKQLTSESKALDRLKGELDKTNKKLDDFEKESDDAGDSIEETGEAAEKSGDGFTIAKGAISNLIANGLTALVGACKNAISSISNLAEETQEYREDIGKLETAWEAAGKTAEQGTAIYKEFYSVLGEEDRSIEAVNHLAKLVDTEEDMAKWTDIATGVWGTFGDSLPIEGLTEAANETAKVGKLTGVLADALNWAGVNEDDFQASLDGCNSEQERQQLITETLNGLYADAAGLYRENNKSVIEARKATSEYTDTMADLGEAIEPTKTEITNLKNTFLKQLAPAIKKDVIPVFGDLFKKLKKDKTIEKFSSNVTSIVKTVLPPLAKIVKFCAENLETLVKVVGTAVVVFKAFKAVMAVTSAITAAKTAIAGLSAGVGVATKIQAGWNAVMAANPIGAVITAVGLLAGGIALLVASEKDAVTQQDSLTESQREAVTAAEEAADAFKETKEAADELAGAELANIDYTQSLWKELQTLSDENGKVKDGYEGRAQYILGELNSALGTEYSLNGDIIQSYKDISAEIDTLIEKKKAQVLLETYEENYKKAIEGVSKAQQDRAIKAQELAEQEELIEDARVKAKEKRADYEKALDEGVSGRKLQILEALAIGDETSLKVLENTLKQKRDAYNESDANLNAYFSTISQYEEASTAVLEGETGKAIGILSKYGNGFKTAESVVKESADDQKKILEQQVIDTEINAQLTKKAYEDGVEGVSEEMVKTAREQADSAKEEFYKVGGNITKGIAEGAEGEENTKWTLSSSMKRLIDKAVSAAQKAMDAHSPSRRFKKEVGRLMGLGVAVGIDDSTKDVVKSVKRQVKNIENAYDLRGISKSVDVGISAKSNDQSSGTNAPKAQNGVVVNQTNYYSQAHSRYELYKSKLKTAAAVRLAVQGV